MNLTVADGEFVVLCGKSGCGKTTVTRLINGLIPHFFEGRLSGTVLVNGLSVSEEPLIRTSGIVGSVFQNPSSQFFNVDTTGEMAFGCENQGLKREVILERICESKQALQLGDLMGRSIFELSGGEKQQVACGSVYAAHPEVFVLDEPSSNMDVQAIDRLHAILAALKKKGKSIVVSEHRLYYLMDLADRFLYIRDGRIAGSYTPETLRGLSCHALDEMGLRCTSLWGVKREGVKAQVASTASAGVQITDLVCKRNKKMVLDIPALELPKGSVIALVGENGAGKSTLAGCLCGILKCKGKIAVNGQLLKAKQRAKLSYMVMQDVNHQLFCDSVINEVTMNLPEEQALKVSAVLKKMELDAYAERHPASLSGGQKQRVAICAALCASKQLLFYDEPTSGLDYSGMKKLCTLIQASQEKLQLTVVVTHDLELILGCCTHVLKLKNGRVESFYPLDETGIDKVRKIFITGGEKSV
nr:ABC transporter ATP-binding protein [Eubacterium sp. 1001713B170207_170306_E7]